MKIQIDAPPSKEKWSPDFTAGTTYLVEATSFEQLTLWQQWHEKVEWKEHPQGKAPTVGLLDGRPVVLCFFYAHLSGAKVMFWYATSQVVDYLMIDDYLKENFPDVPRTDAMNFAHAVP